MDPGQQSTLKRFLDSIAPIPWFARAGESHESAAVVADVVAGWDDWNARMLAVWKPNSDKLERAAAASIGDTALDEIFNAVSGAIDCNARAGMQAYFDRRPADSPNTETNADLGLWPDLLETIKRDVAWAAVEAVLENRGFFTQLMDYYRDGRWPCAWHGEYPCGKIVVL